MILLMMNKMMMTNPVEKANGHELSETVAGHVLEYTERCHECGTPFPAYKYSVHYHVRYIDSSFITSIIRHNQFTNQYKILNNKVK